MKRLLLNDLFKSDPPEKLSSLLDHPIHAARR